MTEPAPSRPSATYRVQFSRSFTFADARAIVPYLADLGITHLYASPVLAARPGSAHGYDVIDPARINPDYGGPDAFAALADALRARGMGLVLDIVPNHMAAVYDNPWWWDVLANGPASRFARYFDIDWTADIGPAGPRIILPILATGYRAALARGDFTVALDERGFIVRYARRPLPLEIGSWQMITSILRADEPGDALRSRLDELDAQLAGVPVYADPRPDRLGERARRRERAEALVAQIAGDGSTRAAVEGALTAIDPERLDELLSVQPYRLRFWRNGIAALNYRRFADNSDLVGVRVEDPDVFAATHALIGDLVDRGLVDGLRIDHLDGLWDPERYLQRLAARCPRTYLVVEKVLAAGETLPETWPVAGTTGYEFVDAVAGVVVDGDALPALSSAYAAWIGTETSFDDVVVACKKRVIRELFAPEFRRLTRALTVIAGVDPDASADLSDALLEVTVHLRVYRTYAGAHGTSPADRVAIDDAARRARSARADLSEPIEQVRRILQQEHPGAGAAFVMRWQQFTGPVTAKGVEDTALYADNRLLALNDVGIDLSNRPGGVAAFHRRNLHTQAHWPGTLTATSTHDSKRSEDVRARLGALSEIPERWADQIARWRAAAAPLKPRVRGTAVPGPNMELHIYQTLLGAWPLGAGDLERFPDRVAAYVVKAAREARLRTSWLEPDEYYERALSLFTRRLLDPRSGGEFLALFQPFQRDIAYGGMLNALAQVLLKTASPGVPDFYQGSEVWTFALVDPDNRRPVEYARRQAALAGIMPHLPDPEPRAVEALLAEWPDGRIKLYATAAGLGLRRQVREVFDRGRYLPLTAAGTAADRLCGFARCLDQTWIIAAVPRLVMGWLGPQRLPVGSVWGDTRLVTPAGAPRSWHDVLTGRRFSAAAGIPAAVMFETFPGALLVGGAS